MRKASVLVAPILACLVLVVTPFPVRTQTAAGTIAGDVTDHAGGLIPGAVVTLEGLTAPGSWKATTDARGRFRFVGVAPGRYRLRVELAGFKPAERDVVVSAGQSLSERLVLEVAGVQETVAVTGATPGISTSTQRSYASIHAPWRHASGQFNTTSFDTIDESSFRKPAAEPLSTFAVDVDTASYAFVRRSLTQGVLPPRDAVRVEELLNYFRYDYPDPEGAGPLAIATEVGPCPWHRGHLLAHVGVQARRPAPGGTPARNLVFLLDVSGSMQPPDKLPLVRSAMGLLVRQLTERDTVAIVVYAGSSGVVLEPTAGDNKERILSAINGLSADGSTNGAEGLETAYRLAGARFARGGVNRVILASDGDFNTGMSSRSDVVRLIEEKRKSGIFLSVLGVGEDNLEDGLLQALADRGNGNYAYLDSLEEAHKVLVREAGATLVTVAEDVKIQVEFNPAAVAAYRLIGYENRVLDAADFKDDRKDAGEMGAGHSVTALYEVIPVGATAKPGESDALRYQEPRRLTNSARASELMLVKVRYKTPDGDAATPMEVPVRLPAAPRLTSNLGFSAAVAAFGMLLRNSPHKGDATWRMVADLGRKHRGWDDDGYRSQFVRLAEVAAGLSANARGGER